MPTIDEELYNLEQKIRHLKIEYDIFFAGGKKIPPTNERASVESLIQQLLERKNFSFVQKFKFNTLVARYNAYKELWRKKLKEREERGILREEEVLEDLINHNISTARPRDSFVLVTNDPAKQMEAVQSFYKFISDANIRITGDDLRIKFDKFFHFLEVKTTELKQKYHCETVEFKAKIDPEKNKLKLSAKVKK